MRFRPAFLFLSALVPATAFAAPVPPPVADMLKAAVNGGDAGTVQVAVDLAKKTNPQSATEIDRLVAQYQAEAKARREAKLRRQGFLRGWSGQGQVGAAYSTGNSRNTAVALGFSLKRDGLYWRHALTATADYQHNDGADQRERYFASYESNYKVTDRFYVLGVFSWERDRFSGFTSRLSEALGLGYSVIKTPTMTLNLEGGPALRQTRYITGENENNFAGRAAIDYQWQITPTLNFSQNLAAYGQSSDSTVTSNTALTTKLLGNLSAQLSFLAQYESNPPLGLENTDTTSRVTLVYSF